MKLKISKLLLFFYCLQSLGQITPNDLVLAMGRGINLGNVLSAPNEGDWAPSVEESYFDDISLIGFKTVRVPIRFDNYTTPLNSVNYSDNLGNYTGSIADYTVNQTYLNRIEQVIDWSLSKGLITIIDVHGDKWFWESYDPTSPYYKTGNDLLAAEDRFKAIWRDLSVRFQNKSDLLLFEIMNEPFFSMSAAQVNTTNSQIIPIIRQTNPNRNIIITGGGVNSFNAPLQISDAILNSDSHLIATFHYYKPFSFTSSSSEQYTDNDWGTQADKDNIINDFNIVKNWSLQKNIPIFLGEFGADNENGYNYFDGTYGLYGGPDVNSRRIYHEFVANLGIANGFSICAWDGGDKSNKTIYKVTNKDWVIDVRNAILNAQCETSGIIENANVECNYDFKWGISTTNGAIASINNALVSESYLQSKTINLNVLTAGTNYDNVILKNTTNTTDFVVGQNYSFKCSAKGSNNQSFKIRIKAMVNNQVSYQTSPVFNLNDQYQEYQYNYNVIDNTTSLEFQIICGVASGNYFFDNFSMLQNILGNQDGLFLDADICYYPNPVNKYLYFDTNKEIALQGVYNLTGQKISNLVMSSNRIDFTAVQDGVYFVNINSSFGEFKTFKVIVKK